MDYRDAKLLWPAIYKAVHEILGDAHVILPLGDELIAGKVNATTFEAKAMGATAPADLTWTPNEALSAWDTPFDLTEPDNWRGAIPILTFNGTDEEADTPDDGFYTRDDAGGANGFSVGAWVLPEDTATLKHVLAKDDENTVREWRFYVDVAEIPILELIDNSAGASAKRPASVAISTSALTLIVATYDGAGGASAADTINVYVNGVSANGTAVNNGSYVGMEDLGGKLTLGARIAPLKFFAGKMAGGPIGPFFSQKELTATAVLDLYHIGAHVLGLA